MSYISITGTGTPVAPGSILAVGNVNVYVNPNTTGNPAPWGTGNDANDGLSRAFPKRTVQAAYNTLVLYNYQGIYSPTIILANGDFTAGGIINFDVPVVGSSLGYGVFNLQADTTTNYTTCTLNQIIVGSNVTCGAASFSIFTTSGGCVELTGGTFICSFDLAFNGRGTPYVFFFKSGGGNVTANFCNLHIGTPTDAQGWSGFVAAEVSGGFGMHQTNVFLPVLFDLSISGGYWVSMSGTYNQTNITWTNFGGVNGRSVQFFGPGFITTDNGEFSDVPGSSFVPTDVTADVILLNGNETKLGTTNNIIAGPIVATNVPQYTNAIVKDGTSHNHYLAVNDGGSFYVKQIGRIPNIQTASYHVALTDQDGRIVMNVAGANTVTFDPHSTTPMPAGAEVKVTQRGVGVTTPTAGVGVTGVGFAAFPAQNATLVFYQEVIDTWVQTGA